MKVYGALVWAGRGWSITPSPNGGRQVRAVAAVPSRAAFGRLLEAHGCRLTRSELQQVSITGNTAEVASATSTPGVLFHATADQGPGNRVYVQAPPC